MQCTLNIVPCLVRVKYIYHDLLAYVECTVDPFDSEKRDDGGPLVCTPQQWEMGLQILGLLGLMHMSSFGHITKANVGVKKLLAFFHG